MRILLVSPISPYGQSAGGQLRTRLLLEALQGMGEVDILVLRQEDKPEPEFSTLEPNGLQVALAESRPWHRRCMRHASRLTQRIPRPALPQPIPDYDIVVGRYLWPICSNWRFRQMLSASSTSTISITASAPPVSGDLRVIKRMATAPPVDTSRTAPARALQCRLLCIGARSCPQSGAALGIAAERAGQHSDAAATAA